MKLTTEEISNLRRQLKILKKSLDTYFDYMKSREIKRGTGDEFNQIGDVLTENQYQREFEKYNKIMDILVNSEYIKEYPTEEIGIGTKFTIIFSDDDEEKQVLLTEGGTSLGTSVDFISILSPLGKNVIGKKEGESFEYMVENNKIRVIRKPIQGIIKEIHTDPKHYLHYIKERDIHNRMSRKARREHSDLRQSTNIEDIERYNDEFAITESQVMLLDIEAKRLLRKKRNNSEKSRLAHISKLLRTAKRAEKPTGDTIGIGSIFEISITNGEEVKTGEYEMINSAVSEELEDAYIEKISPIGTVVFGLKENDTFSFIKNYKTYHGVVTKVENEKTSISTTGYQYQKK